MKVKLHHEIWNDRLAFLFYREIDGKRYVIKPFEFTEEAVTEGMEVLPTFSISGLDQHEFLKSLADELEKMGIKTDTQLQEETKNKGVLSATKYHLEDMRKLVFKENENHE